MISRQPFSPQSLLALLATTSALLSSSNAAEETLRSNAASRSLQDQPYQFTSPHVKARASAISKDFQSITSFLAQDNGPGRANARDMYELGAYCQSYAKLKLNSPVQNEITQGTTVTGTADGGAEVKGILHIGAFPGVDEVEIMYLIPDAGITKICSVAGNPIPQYDLCFKPAGEIKVDGGDTLAYTGYDVDIDTVNDLSFQSMSMGIVGAATVGYPRIGTFASFYGTNKYADKFIQAAFDRVDTTLKNGNAEFTKFTQFGTNKFIEVATLTMSTWMHIVIKLQDAVEVCKSLPSGQKTVNEVPLWDNAVGIYRGMGGAPGGTMGQYYHLANQYCAKFGTCEEGPGNTQGTAQANQWVYTHFNSGKQDLLDGKCELAEAAIDEIATGMVVPLIQGLLYHAYELDLYKEQREVVQGEAAAFLHSVLPLVTACSQGNGVLVYNQIKVGNGKTASFEAIKSSLEGQYDCLGISCEDVGGIVDLSDPTKYQKNAAPCGRFVDNNQDGIPDDNNGDGVPDTLAPHLPPIGVPVTTPTMRPSQDDSPTSTPTDPPSSVYQKIDYEAPSDDGVTYALAVGLPLLSLIAVLVVVVRSYRAKKEHGKEFDSGETGGVDPSLDGTEDELKVENLQGEML